MKADLILYNGNLRTQDSACPRAEAVAMAAGRIIAVGGDDAVRSMTSPNTLRIDLQGRLCLPGMIDSHFHFYSWALGRRHLDLTTIDSLAGLLGLLTRTSREKSETEWIVGWGFNETNWPESRVPNRKDLDQAVPRHPVAIWRCDTHLAVANSRALEICGIDASTPDPREGFICRDATGHPDGVLKETAPNLLRAAIPGWGDREEIREAMCQGITDLHSIGLTGVCDARLMGGKNGAAALRAWQDLDLRGVLGLRCQVAIAGERLDEAITLGLTTGFGGDRLCIGPVKYFADGAMGARTAWMKQPYRDGGTGMPLTPMPALAAAVEKAEQSGLSVMIHAIGDRATEELSHLFVRQEQQRQHSGKLSLTVPHRIEHLQMATPETLKRLGSLQNVAVCVQPVNLMDDIRMIDETVGARGRHAYALRSMLDAGVCLLLGSDCPVCDPNPMLGIYAAVTRRGHDGEPPEGWYPDQCISVAEAIRGYTIAPARAAGLGDEIGSITPGKRADMIVLDRDIYAIDPQEIRKTEVMLTVFDGEIVYEKK